MAMLNEGWDVGQLVAGKRSRSWRRKLKDRHDGGRGRRRAWDLESFSLTGEKRGSYCLLGFASSPSIVKKPPNDSSSGCVGFSFASIPTSTFVDPCRMLIFSSQASECGLACQKAFTTSDCDIVS